MKSIKTVGIRRYNLKGKDSLMEVDKLQRHREEQKTFFKKEF